MMKKLLLLFSLLPLFALSQTIVSTAPMNRTVVLEEFTAINCGNCPNGHTAAANLISQHGSDVSVIAVHGGGLANPSGSQPDFRTTDGANIWSAFGVFGQPTGLVNRTGGPTGTSQWSNSVQSVLAQNSPANIGVSSTYDNSTGMLSVSVEVYFTATPANSNSAIYVSLTEDNIIGYQQNYSSGASNTYSHMHVLRDMLTDPSGDPVSNSTSGMFVQRSYSLPIDPSWDLSNLNIVAFVGEDNGAVYQSVEIDADGGITTDVEEEQSRFRAEPFPNPASDLLSIPLDGNGSAQLQLFDATGRMVSSLQSSELVATMDVSFLESGTYFLLLDGKETKRISISK